ncbi:UDP-N-acetylmuramoyl-tripeptide--D-alanyl-D-alanine ligase [Sphingomonas sp. ID0503]|uniref:UDP-N-acetylmuramoyl-tripeptide--D-alanyl-D- alanine ligase n=1 Tax=Sphingomonas sp. ID0503 TaxID=3399691 RepID=UPI003AFAE888
MTLWTAAEIAAATGGRVEGDFAATGVSFDSREVEPGHLFVAMKGEATDGHRFVAGAYEKGAAGALVSQPVDGPAVLVADTTHALDDLARASRQRTSARIIGITGSVGKTGTKEALADALARGLRGPVHRSIKSYNNHTGVPLSLARMPAETAFGVFEIGMNHAGELAVLTRLVRPHVAIVTAIAPAHSEFFASEAAIADAKGEIFQGLEPGGTAIIPHDSPHRDRLIAAAEPYAGRIWTFGRDKAADIHAIDAIEVESGGTFVTACLPVADVSFTIAQAGAHWVSNALAVMAAVAAVDGDLASAGLALADMAGLAGRGERREVALEGGTATIVDESYNANPASMAATIATLGAMPAKRRIVVLGEMRELGAGSADFHAGLAAPILAANVDRALLVGEGMAPLGRALEGRIELAHLPDAAAAIDMLGGTLAPGDAVLVKGSNVVGLSRVVAALATDKS